MLLLLLVADIALCLSPLQNSGSLNHDRFVGVSRGEAFVESQIGSSSGVLQGEFSLINSLNSHPHTSSNSFRRGLRRLRSRRGWE